jgi:hypothetical protein
VTLKATVSTVVVTTLVLEGWSRELNPDLHIMDTLRDMLAVDWKERLSRAVDKVGGAGAAGWGGSSIYCNLWLAAQGNMQLWGRDGTAGHGACALSSHKCTHHRVSAHWKLLSAVCWLL